MRIIECEQLSEEWYKIRCGIPSASNFDKIITTKGESSKQAQKYLYQLAGEYVTGQKEQSYQNAAMLRGIELEQEAKNLYQIINEVVVESVGFCIGEPDIEYGCSPDGLVGDKGLVEIKCPNLATHVGYLLDNKAPTEYFQQMQGQLLVTGREWVDFMSYYPAIRPLIVRVQRDEEFIKKLRIELEVFCTELNKIINKIK